MSSVKVESVVGVSALIGEGPVWEESEQMLLFVDIVGQKIHRWSPMTNQIQSMETGTCCHLHLSHLYLAASHMSHLSDQVTRWASQFLAGQEVMLQVWAAVSWLLIGLLG